MTDITDRLRATGHEERDIDGEPFDAAYYRRPGGLYELADDAIVALLERWEECERRFDLAVEKCERMIARAEKAEAEVEEAWACVEGYKQTAEEERAEVERLKWMLVRHWWWRDYECGTICVFCQARAPFDSGIDDIIHRDDCEYADLAARYEQEVMPWTRG